MSVIMKPVDKLMGIITLGYGLAVVTFYLSYPTETDKIEKLSINFLLLFCLFAVSLVLNKRG